MQRSSIKYAIKLAKIVLAKCYLQTTYTVEMLRPQRQHILYYGKQGRINEMATSVNEEKY